MVVNIGKSAIVACALALGGLLVASSGAEAKVKLQTGNGHHYGFLPPGHVRSCTNFTEHRHHQVVTIRRCGPGRHVGWH